MQHDGPRVARRRKSGSWFKYFDLRGKPITDEELTAFALAADPELSALKINVDTTQGNKVMRARRKVSFR